MAWLAFSKANHHRRRFRRVLNTFDLGVGVRVGKRATEELCKRSNINFETQLNCSAANDDLIRHTNQPAQVTVVGQVVASLSLLFGSRPDRSILSHRSSQITDCVSPTKLLFVVLHSGKHTM